jgi:hypothetical protein
MNLTYEKFVGFEPAWQWVATSGSLSEQGREPLDALTKLATTMTVDLGISGPELLAETRLNPFGNSGHYPWSAAAGDGAETYGPDPAHAMYLLCEMLELALEEQNKEATG